MDIHPTDKARGLLLSAFQRGQVDEIAWVDLALGDLVVTVAADALKAPLCEPQSVRLPVTYEEAITICRALECVSPTQAIADAMYAAAKVRLVAAPLPPTAQLDTVKWTQDFQAAIGRQVDARGPAPTDLLFGGWKLWILHPRIVEKGAVNYGFWDARGKPIQTVGGRHDAAHTDYSQLLQPVQRWARRTSTGAFVDLLDHFAAVDRVPARYLDPYRAPAERARFDARPIDLLQTLTAAGVRVASVDGWQRRGRPGLVPEGVMLHHTAGARHGDAPSLSLCVDGRPGLSGPLCNILLGRDGTAHLVAANIANHAGPGAAEVLARVTAGQPVSGDARDHGYKDAVPGNGPFYGIEVENSGQGDDGYPKAQIAALVKICAALCTAKGWTADRIVHHRQWTMRKVDMSYGDDLIDAVRRALNNVSQSDEVA